MWRAPIIAIAMLLMVSTCSIGRADDGLNAALSTPPTSPDPSARYLFYLHGAIIETAGRRPRHPRFGVYEYDEVLRALGRSGAVVISEQRHAGTAIRAYADKVVSQVKGLIDHGVPARQISIIGFSKGGAIAQAVSAKLHNPDVRYVLLGACPSASRLGPLMHGKVLAITERSDSVPSCQALFSRSKLKDSRELQISIGGEHGAFYRPQSAWLDPLLEFVR
jgi:hypothetical protein